MFDLTEASKSFLSLMQSINSAVTQTVGLDVLWCRAVPPEKSEDVILDEYSLLNVECPKQVRVVTNKTDYQPGNFNVDVFGITYESPLEISIDISTWKDVYGPNLIPQKSDIVYVKIVHKLYEVLSSTIVYTVGEMPTSFKVQLSKYNPSSSRRESKELRKSIEDLTVNQEELFGEKITDDVTDITDPILFDYNHTSKVDPYKSVEDISSGTFIYDFIVHNDLKLNSNLFSVAQYDFSIAKENIIYNRGMDYTIDSSRNYLIYSCWAKSKNQINEDLAIKYLKKIGTTWTLLISAQYKLEIGDEIQIYRGTFLNVTGKVATKETKSNYTVTVPISEVMLANRKLTGWEKLGGWKIKNINKLNLLSGYYENNKIFSLDINFNKIYINFNNSITNFELPTNFDFSKWNYISIIISPTNNHIFILERTKNGRSSKICDLTNKQIKNNINLDKFSIENKGSDFEIANIRLYENEYDLTEKEFKLDATSRFERNASKTIITDDPNIENKMDYIGSAK